MTTKRHTHRAIRKLGRVVGWTHCVKHGPCSGEAHGAVVHFDECSCGHVRYIEVNGRHKASSGWVEW